MLGTIRSAIEHDDHFEVDDGTDAPFVVRKAELSQAQVDKVRRLYCGGKVQRFVAGGRAMPEAEADADPGVADGGVMPSAPADDSGVAPIGLEPASPVARQIAEASARIDALVPARGVDVGQGVVSADEPAVVPAGQPAVVPAGQAAVVPAGQPAVVPAGQPAVVPAAQLAAVPAGQPAIVPPAQSGVPALRPDQYGYADVEVSPAAAVPELAPAADIGARLEPAKIMGGLTGVEAADVAALQPEAAARVQLERSQEAARRRDLEQARRGYLEREADRVGAEQEAAQLVDIARRNKQAETAAREEYRRRGEALKDTEKTRIEAFRLFERMEGWQRVVAAISVIGGAALSARSKRPNLALKVIEGAIDTDIESQKQEMATARANRLTEYQAAGATLAQASDLVRADMLTVASARARASAARSTSRAARDAFEGLATTLDVKRDEAVLRAIHDMGAAAVAQAAQRRALATEVRLAEIRDATEKRAAEEATRRGEEHTQMMTLREAAEARAKSVEARSAEEHKQAMRLREAADRRAEKQLRLQAAAQATAARESRARIGHMAAAEKRARLADQNLPLEMLTLAARAGQKISPVQRAMLKKEDSDAMVPTADGNYRAANSVDAAKRWQDISAAGAEVNQAMKRLEPFLRLDEAGKKRDAPDVGWFGGANAAAVESHHKALMLALGKLARAGDLSENQRQLFESLAPKPQAWGTTDEAERGSYDALSARVLGTLDELERSLLVPLKP